MILDVEASRSIRSAEVGATQTMIARTRERFDLTRERLAADTAYGSGGMLGWLVGEGIEPHIPVIDKSERRDGTFSNAEFRYDPEADAYTCPAGKALKKYWRQMTTPRDGVSKDGFRRYYARQRDCRACPLKERCTPNQPARKIARHVHEAARDAARRIATTDAYVDASRRRKKVEMLFAHLKRPKPPETRQTDPRDARPGLRARRKRTQPRSDRAPQPDFFNTINPKRSHFGRQSQRPWRTKALCETSCRKLGSGPSPIGTETSRRSFLQF